MDLRGSSKLGPPRLSKSKIAAFEQCPKRLWLQVHRQEEAQADASVEARIKAGHEVGYVARSLCADGIMVEAKPNLGSALRTTAELVSTGARQPLFEATFERDGVLVRIDVLEPGFSGWRMAEVKSSTGLKDYYLADVATQLWTLEGSGATVEDACVRHLNRDFILEREGEYRGLFVDKSVLEAIQPLVDGRREVVDAARVVLEGGEPDQDMGGQCSHPFECEFQAYCKRGRSEPTWPITLLPDAGRKLAQKWAVEGIFELTDVPRDTLTNPLHIRILDATASGATFHDCDVAIDATKSWAYPRTWLDFETIAFAVPKWIGTHPYEQIPFQFSAHVEREDGSTTHHEFLSLDGSDPREACACALVQTVPEKGAVIAYFASFERARVEELAAACPQYGRELRAIAARIVDLLPVVRTCWYHRDQRGSFSIKAVLPTIEATGYDGLHVADGTAAQLAYLEAIRPDTNQERKEEIDRALRAYCKRDTEAMIAVFRRITREH